MSEFDEKASTWDDDPSRVDRAKEITEFLKTRVDLLNVVNALEYGSGTGLLSFNLRHEISNITLMDDSIEMTRVAQEKCNRLGVSNLHPTKSNLLEDPLPEDRYDLIYMMLTLHHVEQAGDLLQKFAKLLNKNGTLAIIDLEKEDGSFHDGPFHGHKGFEKNKLENMLHHSGLNPQSFDICYTIKKETDNGLKEFPVFLSVSLKSH